LTVLCLCQNILGRLLAMLFDWYDATAYLRDGIYHVFYCICCFRCLVQHLFYVIFLLDLALWLIIQCLNGM